jgi:hypothetical protein
MSKLKIRLFGLLFLALSFVALATATPTPANACADVIAYAINNTTGECREFPTRCSIPRGWTFYSYTGCPTS